MWGPVMLLFFVLGYIFSMYLLTQFAYVLFNVRGVVTRNYLGLEVVQSFGLLISIHYAFFLFVLFFYEQLNLSWLSLNIQRSIGELPMFLLGLGTITLIGWVDDKFGSDEVKGFRGHLLAFFVDHKLTTGFLKAVIGSLVAFICMYKLSETNFQWLVYAGLVIFSIHVFNLLDMRPGRTIKCFWFLTLLLIPFYTFSQFLVYVFPALISTMLIFPYERKYLTMLGDAGSNVLGFIFGYALVQAGDTLLNVAILLCFVFISLLAEKVSLSHYIQKTPWLAKVDNWGICKFSVKEK